ncbi:hypothetical protein K461DRAFT_283077 [Myriangium duriaei CBS 260.36]|uniref:Peptidase A1 domain-containing protein n=1 Tax=Myriangium duriaei CBS 260.36 TaxID=1168546 RepID=A0A9P4IPX5_9PEZI|nr:hypothetical protein K461DRAFT_283077 [Myriangium duriaei CBS 260.36]
MRLHPFFSVLPFLVGSSLAAPHSHDALVSRTAGEPVRKRVLAPAVHWTVSTGNTQHAAANIQQSVYYTDDGIADPSIEHRFGSTTMNFSIPAVNLDHSDHVSIGSADGQATVTFTNQAAFDAAESTWLAPSELLLLTYQPLCANFDAKDFCYILASNIKFDEASLSAIVDAQSVELRDYVISLTTEWGIYSPDPVASPIAMRKRERRAATSTSACDATDSNGLPTVTLGPNFDARLDKCRGSKPASQFPWYKFAGAVGANQETESEVEKIPHMKGDQGLLKLGLAASAARAKASQIEATATADGSPMETNLAVRHAEEANQMDKRFLGFLFHAIPFNIPGVNAPLSKDFTKDLSFSVPKNRGTDDSPWGKAKLLKKYTKSKSSSGGAVTAEGNVTLYCVDCGASGSAHFYGKASYSVADGLTEGYATANVNLNVGFALGMEINAKFTAKESTELENFGFDPTEYGAIVIGPQITIGADFTFEAEADGKLLAGARFIIQNADARLDFVNTGSSHANGFTPEFVPIFEASGKIGIGAEIGLPLAFSLGIDVLKGKFVKRVGIVERPAIEAKAEFAAEADLTGGRIVVTDGCHGVSTQVNFKNELYADIVGTHYNLIAPYTKNLAKGCIKIGQDTNTTSSSAVSSSVEPTGTPSPTSDGMSSPSATDGSAASVTSADSQATPSNGADPSATESDSGPSATPGAGFVVVEAKYVDTVEAPTIAAEESITHQAFHGYNTTGHNATEYTELVDSSAKYFLAACPDSNIYIQPRTQQGSMANLTCARVFESHRNTSSVVGDGNSRLFHYYSDSMEKLGVSRLRLHKNSAVPKGAVFVAFQSFANVTGTRDKDVNDDSAGSQDYFIARNEHKEPFYPVVCSYKDYAVNPAKMFLVMDPDDGIKTLESEEVQGSITGGEVDTCFVLPMMQPVHETGTAWNNRWGVNQDYEGAAAGKTLDGEENW